MSGPFYDNPGQYDRYVGSLVKDELFYAGQASSLGAATALELGCGTGRVALYLAKSGIDVTGVDVSSSMLQKAQEKAKAANVRIDFQKNDMRSLDLKREFDFICSPHGSFHHLTTHTDLKDALSSVKSHLHKKARFCFDVSNPEIKLLAQESWKKFLVHKYSSNEGEAETQVYQQTFYDSKNQLCYFKWIYESEERVIDQQEFCLRMYYPQELDFILNSAGFKILQKYGSADQAEFTSASRHQFFVCEKHL